MYDWHCNDIGLAFRLVGFGFLLQLIGMNRDAGGWIIVPRRDQWDPYSTSSIRYLYNVRTDWYWIGTRLVKDCMGLSNLRRPYGLALDWVGLIANW